MADTFQALVNLVASFGFTDGEMKEALEFCILKNDGRGRYGQEEQG